VRLEGEHGARQAAVLCLAAQQGSHGLVSAVDAVEIADGQGAGGGQGGVVDASEDLHDGGLSPAARLLRLGSAHRPKKDDTR